MRILTSEYNQQLFSDCIEIVSSCGNRINEMRLNFRLALILFTAIFFISTGFSQIIVDVESGVVMTGYNNVRIPGNQGTLFSLKEDLKPNAPLFLRLRAGYTYKSRHHISLLYAPLKVVSTGSFSEDIEFQGVLFPAGENVKGSYMFNSYRLTYRYVIVDNPGFKFGLGFTGKIRHADITLKSAGLSAGKPDLGFVPIINFSLAWQQWERLGFLLEGDALAAPQGRAEDVLLAAMYTLSDQFTVKAGYRILEGGADNRSVYTFSLFHYAALGVIYRVH